MNEFLEPLLARHRQRGVLVDTNLLLLYLVGEFDRRLVPKAMRTKGYTVDDYQSLKRLVELFAAIITTPNVLTEVSNLSGDVPEHLRQRFFELLRERMTGFDERFRPSATGAAHPVFTRFGLTDAVIAQIADEHCLVLTADFPLANYLTSRKLDVINFNHLRSLAT